MKRSVFVLWIATLLAIIFLSLTQRYTITQAADSPYGYKLDKLTGKVWFLKGVLRQVLVPIETEKEEK